MWRVKETGREKETIKGFASKTVEKDGVAKYECEFNVNGAFGFIGAVLVENEHHKEMYLEEIVLDGLLNGPVTLSCRSWVASKFDNPQKRVFFVDKVWPCLVTRSDIEYSFSIFVFLKSLVAS